MIGLIRQQQLKAKEVKLLKLVREVEGKMLNLADKKGDQK